MGSKIKKVLLWIWQLPQNLLGWILTGIIYKKIDYDLSGEIVPVYYKNNFFGSGVSLGNYIFLDRLYLKYVTEEELIQSIRHEHGHQIQSKYLGIFYLIIIGIPSFFGNIAFRLFNIEPSKYYDQPWEHWADKLGGVSR